MSVLIILSYLKMNQNYFDAPYFDKDAFLCVSSVLL